MASKDVTINGAGVVGTASTQSLLETGLSEQDAMTARCIVTANYVPGIEPNVDLKPYSTERFE